jgi:G3E family GTPase
VRETGVPLDGVIIETTGLADPAPVAQSVLVDTRCEAEMRLDAIVTLVDAKHVLAHLDDTGRTPGAENEAEEQIAFADRLILNKTDLVSPAELATVRARVRAINGNAPLIQAVRSDVPVASVLGVRAFDVRRILAAEPDFLKVGDPLADAPDHIHDGTVTSVGIEEGGSVDEGRLNAWLSRLLAEQGTDLFRSKGILAIEGSDARFVFQGVHMMLQIGSSGEAEGAGGWRPDEPRVNRLVFIGRNLDRAALTASFRACLVA